MRDRPLFSTPGLRATLMAFIASRILIAIVTYLAIDVIKSPPPGREATGIMDAFVRWDVAWYLDVARNGYQYYPGEQSNVVFFPGYPLLMHLGTLGFLSLKHGGMLISNVCAFAAGLVIWRLIRLDGDERAADLGVRFFFFGPVSFFFSIGYSEAAFILFVGLSLLGARTGRWWLAGLAGYAAALTRSVGVLLVIPLVFEFWTQEREREPLRSFQSWIRLFCAGLPGMGTLSYMAYMALKFGDPLVYRKAEIYWGRELMPFWQLFSHSNVTTLSPFYFAWFHGALLFAILLTVVGLCMRVRRTYLVMCGCYLLLYTSTGLLEAIPRYLSVIVPFYLILGRWVASRPSLELPLTVATSALLTLATVLFSTGYWFT